MLARQRQAFAPVFYRRHRNHVLRVVARVVVVLLASAGLAGWSIASFLRTDSALWAAAMFSAVFLFALVASIFGIRDVFHVALLPYFSQRLGDSGTFLRGRAILWHSRLLDDLAARLAVRPISDFASGDDLVLFEKLQWFAPGPALETVNRIRECDTANSFPEELRVDLEAMATALASAQAKEVQFCFLIREGSSTSGIEMSARKGSFF